ncbi:MAG: outer membrane beta-barrel protein [Thermoanaerobaculia bacterium]
MNRFLNSQRYVQLIMTFTAGLLLAGSLYGQSSTGNIYGKVSDRSGQPLPGVTVVASSDGPQQTFVTEADGAYRFLRLPPGRYKVTADLSGFSPATRNVDVNIGANTDIPLTLSQQVSEVMTVTAATPLIDMRDAGTKSAVTQEEIEQLPTARDPWVLLQQMPGVLVDRVNVGGNKSGQQSSFVSKGVERHQTGWNIDGVTVTEMDETGTSTFYYDFGSLQEFQVTTATADPSVRTPGAQINMVTKRGSNSFSGSARGFWTDESLQAKATLPDSIREGNKIDNIREYGGDFGGPIVHDKLWFYGAASENRIGNITFNYSFPQVTKLTNYTGKLSGQPLQNNSANVYYMFSDKTVNARDLSATRPPETARRQSGPSWVGKLEDTHIFSNSFVLTGLYSRVDGGYKQEPRGGMDIEPYWINTQGLLGENRGWHNTYRLSQQWIKQNSYRLDGSTFFHTGTLGHELKVGAGYRDAPAEWLIQWPGNMGWGEFYTGGDNLAAFTRAGHPIYTGEYNDTYVGDTMTWNNLTVQAGLRYDLQKSFNKASAVAANPVIPDILKATSYPGDTRKLKWESISPRIGATYAIGQSKRTAVRGSYNRYVDQLGSSDAGASNPFYYPQILYYYWSDANGDKKVQKSEVDFASGIYSSVGLDPDNFSNAAVSNGRIDYDHHKPTTTDEFLVGVDHELLPGFAVGATFTHRNRKNFVWDQYEKTQGQGDFFTAADYVLASAPFTGSLNGQPFSIPYYQLKVPSQRPTFYATRNRPDYSQSYDGLELTAQKRMNNRWEMRGQLTWGDWKQHVGAAAIQNPSPLLFGDGCFTCDGGAVASSSGSDGYINARWSGSLTGIYQLPWQMTFGTVITGREGYINGFNVSQRVDRVTRRYVINKFEDYRFPNLYQVDLRLARQIRVAGNTGVELSVDAFNVTNQRAILWRDYTVTSASPTPIQEIQSPRVVRLGAKVSF